MIVLQHTHTGHNSIVHSVQENGLLTCQRHVPQENARGHALDHERRRIQLVAQKEREHRLFLEEEERNAFRRRVVEKKFSARRLIEETAALS